MIYGVELVEGMRGKYWEMWYFEISFQGIEFKENYMPKKYAVAILPLAGFLTTIGAVISFVKKTQFFLDQSSIITETIKLKKIGYIYLF